MGTFSQGLALSLSLPQGAWLRAAPAGVLQAHRARRRPALTPVPSGTSLPHPSPRPQAVDSPRLPAPGETGESISRTGGRAGTGEPDDSPPGRRLCAGALWAVPAWRSASPAPSLFPPLAGARAAPGTGARSNVPRRAPRRLRHSCRESRAATRKSRPSRGPHRACAEGERPGPGCRAGSVGAGKAMGSAGADESRGGGRARAAGRPGSRSASGGAQRRASRCGRGGPGRRAGPPGRGGRRGQRPLPLPGRAEPRPGGPGPARGRRRRDGPGPEAAGPPSVGGGREGGRERGGRPCGGWGTFLRPPQAALGDGGPARPLAGALEPRLQPPGVVLAVVSRETVNNRWCVPDVALLKLPSASAAIPYLSVS